VDAFWAWSTLEWGLQLSFGIGPHDNKGDRIMKTTLQQTIKNLGATMMTLGQEIDAVGYPNDSWTDDELAADIKMVGHFKRRWNEIQAIVMEHSEQFPNARVISNMDGVILGLNQRTQVSFDILHDRMTSSAC